MAKLAIHTPSGHTIEAPLEMWVIAIIGALPREVAQQMLARVGQQDGASIIPDKYRLGEDALGTITIVERPTVDLGGRV